MEIDECDMGKSGTPDSSGKTIAVLGDRWWPQTAQHEGDKMSKKFLLYQVRNIWQNVMSAQILEASQFGVGTVLRLAKDTWSMVK